MNIFVIVKQTFDTEEKIKILDGKVVEDGVEFIINPYDEYAIEEAIKIRDEFGGEVTAITVGPSRAEDTLRTALAMGVDKGIIVDDEALFGDEYTISKVLATIIKSRPFDLILTGNQSIDNCAAQIGPRLAEELEIAQVTSVTKLSINDAKAIVVRDVEGNTEVIEGTLPLLLTSQQGLNEPRYPSLPGILKAKKMQLERMGADDINLSMDVMKPKTITIEKYISPKKEAGIVLAGELESQVQELVQKLQLEVNIM